MNKALTVEIFGTGTHNRGAQLMAMAIAYKLRQNFSNVRIVVPSQLWEFEARTQNAFFVNSDYVGKFATARSFLSRLISKIMPKEFGVIKGSEIDIVLDASGFTFSDQWGCRTARRLFKKMNHAARRNQKLILLPQAFGPFKNKSVADACKLIFNRSSLVCARDSRSLNEVKELASNCNLIYSPDFTIDLPGIESSSIDVPDNFIAIIPNRRMLDKTTESANYIKFLEFSLKYTIECGLIPIFVLHDAQEDKTVISRISGKYSSIKVIEHSNPQVLKGLLNNARGVIGSRFHALVSSLSQGIPCIAAGWSHKYPELMRQFGCEDMLISDLTDYEKVRSNIRIMTTQSSHEELSKKIKNNSLILKSQVNAMWDNVFEIIKN